LVELLVVAGVIALLLSITVPPLQIARRQARSTVCSQNLQQLGLALQNVSNDYDGYFPLWDDIGKPTRYTWIDLLVQLERLNTHKIGYCPEDPQPGQINQGRASFYGLIHPIGAPLPGSDYSYGIAIPLAAGGWSWHKTYAPPWDTRPRRFVGHEEYPAQRLLAADASWSGIWNLSGDAMLTGAWNQPTQFDNTVDYRHRWLKANALFRDGHVTPIAYHAREADPQKRIDTNKCFLWYPGEPIYVGPEHRWGEDYYPDQPAYRIEANGQYYGEYPRDLVPYLYTVNGFWTQIHHK